MYLAGKDLAGVPGFSFCHVWRPVRKAARVGLQPGEGANTLRKNAFACDAVEGRGVDGLVAGERRVRVRLVVGDCEQEVGLGTRGRRGRRGADGKRAGEAEANGSAERGDEAGRAPGVQE